MLPRRRSILRILKGCGRVHQRADVAHRPHVDLAARQERHRAVEVDGEAALDLVEDDAFDLLLVVELLLEPGPALLAARLVARQHGLAQRVLDALEVDLDGVADLEFRRLARNGELAHGHAAFHLEADVDHRQVLLDGGDDALDDAALEGIVLGQRLAQQRGEVLAGGVEFLGSFSNGGAHSCSCSMYLAMAVGHVSRDGPSAAGIGVPCLRHMTPDPGSVPVVVWFTRRRILVPA